jgi:Holliday junction resolvase
MSLDVYAGDHFHFLHFEVKSRGDKRNFIRYCESNKLNVFSTF